MKVLYIELYIYIVAVQYGILCVYEYTHTHICIIFDNIRRNKVFFVNESWFIKYKEISINYFKYWLKIYYVSKHNLFLHCKKLL